MNNAQKETPQVATSGAAKLSNIQHPHHNESPAAKLLSRLDKVKETGRGQWLARCPAHDDGSPSLSVRETDDGTVLLHCFAQCPAGDVLAAVGMELGELFPRRYASPPKSRFERSFNPRDVLAAINHEAHVCMMIASDICQQKTVDDATFKRLALAANRIAHAQEAS